MTNADKIRNMTDEDLAEFLICIKGETRSGTVLEYEGICLKWLKEEVKEKENVNSKGKE